VTVPAATEATRERIERALNGIAHETPAQRDGLTAVQVDREELRAALEALKAAGFESVTFVTAVDHLPRAPRFEVVHQLRSLAHNDRVRVLTRLPDGDPACPTCIDLWPGARYMERECFDLMGIAFTGHDGLKRLLMPEDYEHHPLRKEFPHQGIEPDKLYRRWDAARRVRFEEQA
jgi:NADH:ubiquinone oxidoreductase subunit C